MDSNKNSKNNFFRYSNVDMSSHQENHSQSKFSAIEKLRKNMTLRQTLSSREKVTPHKRLTEPLIKNYRLNDSDWCGMRKTKKNDSLKSKDFLKFLNTLKNGKHLERTEFLKNSMEKIEWKKLSHSQLKIFMQCYIKEILKLGDEKHNELISQYIKYFFKIL